MPNLLAMKAVMLLLLRNYGKDLNSLLKKSARKASTALSFMNMLKTYEVKPALSGGQGWCLAH